VGTAARRELPEEILEEMMREALGLERLERLRGLIDTPAWTWRLTALTEQTLPARLRDVAEAESLGYGWFADRARRRTRAVLDHAFRKLDDEIEAGLRRSARRFGPIAGAINDASQRERDAPGTPGGDSSRKFGPLAAAINAAATRARDPGG
jgi:AcrR family transcriptional regulator